MREALRIHGRVILALMLREARTRYGRRQAGYLWALVEPILHISFFLVLKFFIRGRGVPLGDSAAVFLATGFATFLGFRNVMKRTQGGYKSNEALLSFPIVKIMDVFLSRALLELATWIVVTILLLGPLILIGYGEFPHHLLLLIGAIAALFAIGFGFGTVLGVVSEFVPAIGSFVRYLLRILYVTSAVFYLPDPMPPLVRDIIVWNPVLHGITLFRVGFYPGYESHMLDVRYLFSWAVGCILLALVTEKIARKPIRSLA